MKRLALPVFFGLVASLAASGYSQVASRAQDIRPILVGHDVPDVSVTGMDQHPVTLPDLVRDQVSVLIFYRGGWCPYCNKHLSAIQGVEQDIRALGVQLVGISPDRPELLGESVEKNQLGYTLYSDASADAAKAFGIAFEVDANTLDLYKGYGIDLEASSGQSHHILPVPAVFVINRQGKIAFSHADPDYKQRLSPDVLMAVLKATLAGE